MVRDCRALVVAGRYWLAKIVRGAAQSGITGFSCLPAALVVLAFCAPSASAQQLSSQPFTQPTNQTLTQQSILLSQMPESAPPPTIIPTDVTRSALNAEHQLLYSPLKYKIFSMLPERLWFQSMVEESQRPETNVFFLTHPHAADYVFRSLPNVTLGWNLFGHTAIYCNYFVIKDVFAVHNILTQPTTQSLALGFRQDIPLGRKTDVTIDFQSRELWQARHLHQADLIPTLSISRVVTPHFILFGSALLQMRGREYFCGPNRELDPFFTIGSIYTRGSWNFVASNTYVSNFRRKNAIPPVSNMSMISDFEINRPISRKFPGLVAFVRAEPIWNWGSGGFPGLSGFDFRLFSGIRAAFTKPAYNSEITKLREQLLESEGGARRPPKKVSAPAQGQGSPQVQSAP